MGIKHSALLFTPDSILPNRCGAGNGTESAFSHQIGFRSGLSIWSHQRSWITYFIFPISLSSIRFTLGQLCLCLQTTTYQHSKQNPKLSQIVFTWCRKCPKFQDSSHIAVYLISNRSCTKDQTTVMDVPPRTRYLVVTALVLVISIFFCAWDP